MTTSMRTGTTHSSLEALLGEFGKRLRKQFANHISTARDCERLVARSLVEDAVTDTPSTEYRPYKPNCKQGHPKTGGNGFWHAKGNVMYRECRLCALASKRRNR